MILHEHKQQRLKGFDYSKDGAYFVTICVKDRKEWFGHIRNGEMVLNEYGEIADRQWHCLEYQYNYIHLDTFVVMPDHVHGIIHIVGNNRNYSGRDNDAIKIKPLPEIIGAFKTTSSKLIHLAGLAAFRWQKSFYDHIIQDDAALRNIRRYITKNPARRDVAP